MKKVSIIFEGILTLAILVLTVSFAVRTFSGAPTIKECQEVSASIEKIEAEINDPTKWVVVSVSEDYSEAEVIHNDGYTYTHSIYECYDEDNYLVIILKNQGELHKFIFVE